MKNYIDKYCVAKLFPCHKIQFLWMLSQLLYQQLIALYIAKFDFLILYIYILDLIHFLSHVIFIL